MYKLMAIYKPSENPEAFETQYREEHIPMCKELKGIKEIRLNKFYGSPSGKPDLFMVAELVFETKDDFHAALKSETMMKAGKHAHQIAPGLSSVYFASEEIIKC